MKSLLIGSAVAFSLSLGTASTAGIKTPPREPMELEQSSLTNPVTLAVAKQSARKPVAKQSQPHQGYRCSGPSAGGGKSPPTGAAVVKRFKLTRLKRPTPTSAVVRVDATVDQPQGKELFYTFTVTSGRVIEDGPRATWTVEGVGTYTISLEVYDRGSGCVTFTSATYTIAKPRPTPNKGAEETGVASAAPKPQWEIDYENKMAIYNQELAKQRQAVADYERQKAQVEAKRAELRARAENTQAHWRAAVAACQAGDYSQCSGSPQP